MWNDLISWEADKHVGDLASIVGLLVTLVGFWLTIRAAQRAESAAQRATRRMKLVEDIVDFSAALVSLEEIRRFHRLGHWHLLPDRYANLRKTLISIKSSGSHLNEDQMKVVQGALATLQSIESAVEKGMKDVSSLDGARFNNLLARKADGLQATLTQLKTMDAGARHG